MIFIGFIQIICHLISTFDDIFLRKSDGFFYCTLLLTREYAKYNERVIGNDGEFTEFITQI